jgi:hypothetical protein
MRGGLLSACGLLGALIGIPPAQATVHIHVDLSSQVMHVRSAEGSYDWPISTARAGYRTPRGTYRPQALVRMHYSRKYHMSPMPHSIFFAGGYAIHGTYETRWLGRPASHGCIRLAPGHAAQLYYLVQREGGRITITGTPPHAYAARRRSKAPSGYARLRRNSSFLEAWHPKRHHALAYAPGRRAAMPVKVWQVNPVMRQAPQWPDWP